ncbi:TPA: ATP-binding protein [Legionella pneumophila]
MGAKISSKSYENSLLDSQFNFEISYNLLNKLLDFAGFATWKEDLLPDNNFEILYKYLIQILDIGQFNIWQWDIATNKVIDFGYSDSLSSLTGDKNEVGDLDHFIERVHPDEREKIANKIMSSLSNCEDYHAEFRIQTLKGDYNWVSAHGRFIKDHDNNTIKMMGTWRYIKEPAPTMESVQKNKDRFERLSRCYFSGEIAASLSHEIAQPISALNSYLLGSIVHLQKENIQRNEFINILQNALEQVELINNMITRLKRFVTHGELYFEQVNLVTLMKKSVSLSKLYSNFFGTVQYEFDEHLTKVRLDQNQMRQVFINLINNAFQAMLEAQINQPTLLIKIEGIDSEVMVSIIDNGPGIHQDVIDNLFTPCYSTKEYGFGLGLILCRKIIEAHGGKFRIERNSRGGTTCSIRLPKQIQDVKE